MNFFIESKPPTSDDINTLCGKILSHEIKVHFFEKKISELVQQFQINHPPQNLQHISQTDLNTLHILGFNFKNAQQLPSIGLIGFGLGEFKHEVRQFQKPYDNQQAEQISLMV